MNKAVILATLRQVSSLQDLGRENTIHSITQTDGPCISIRLSNGETWKIIPGEGFSVQVLSPAGESFVVSTKGEGK